MIFTFILFYFILFYFILFYFVVINSKYVQLSIANPDNPHVLDLLFPGIIYHAGLKKQFIAEFYFR